MRSPIKAAALRNLVGRDVLLFRFIASRDALWRITAARQVKKTSFENPVLDAKAHVFPRQACLLLINHSAFLITEFSRDSVKIELPTGKIGESAVRARHSSDKRLLQQPA